VHVRSAGKKDEVLVTIDFCDEIGFQTRWWRANQEMNQLQSSSATRPFHEITGFSNLNLAKKTIVFFRHTWLHNPPKCAFAEILNRVLRQELLGCG
jgi:hypothetical protein